MDSPGEATENHNLGPTAQQAGEALDTDKYNTMEASYPSPTPSARPVLPTSVAPVQTPLGSDSTKEARQFAKNAQEFWKHFYAEREGYKQSSNKRKNHGGSGDRGRAKKRQKAEDVSREIEQTRSSLPEGALDPKTPTSGTGESDDIVAQNSTLDIGDQDNLMQLLGRDVNIDDPQVRQDLRRLYTAALSFGHGRCKLVDGRWEIDGFSTPLYPHQLIGVSWMLSRELDPTGPRGGILADKMGLGKTVQLLACMSQNPPRKKKSNKATKTLIVTHKALIPQWYKEIMRHCSDKKMRQVFVYTGDRMLMPNQFEEANIM
jgi:SNF2 family DNA or RNA helicase